VGSGSWGLTEQEYPKLSQITFIIVYTDPFNTTKALTWLSGSTYGRTLSHVAPIGIALLAAIPVLARSRHELDLLALDDETPRVLGISLDRTRLLLLGVAALLTATAVSAVGVIGFVGLVAPHAARASSAACTAGCFRSRCCSEPSWWASPTPSGARSSHRGNCRPAPSPPSSAPPTSSGCSGAPGSAQHPTDVTVYLVKRVDISQRDDDEQAGTCLSASPRSAEQG